jgi:hypothetical protein
MSKNYEALHYLILSNLLLLPLSWTKISPLRPVLKRLQFLGERPSFTPLQKQVNFVIS